MTAPHDAHVLLVEEARVVVRRRQLVVEADHHVDGAVLDNPFYAVSDDKGTFTINLDAKNAPGNVNNFVNLARFHYYDNHDCHRIIENFVVQCGRPGDESQESAPGYTVGDEVPVRPYQVGDIAMANTGQPNTGGGQFFIITGADGAALPSQYSLIGSIADGLDTTVQAMAAEADPEAANGVPPKSPVTITSVTISEA